MKNALNKSYCFVVTVICIVLAFVILLAVVDRLYGTESMTAAVQGIANEQTQTLAVAALDWVHATVVRIGEFCRNNIPWNHQDAGAYAGSAYVFVSEIA